MTIIFLRTYQTIGIASLESPNKYNFSVFIIADYTYYNLNTGDDLCIGATVFNLTFEGSINTDLA